MSVSVSRVAMVTMRFSYRFICAMGLATEAPGSLRERPRLPRMAGRRSFVKVEDDMFAEECVCETPSGDPIDFLAKKEMEEDEKPGVYIEA